MKLLAQPALAVIAINMHTCSARARLQTAAPHSPAQLLRGQQQQLSLRHSRSHSSTAATAGSSPTLSSQTGALHSSLVLYNTAIAIHNHNSHSYMCSLDLPAWSQNLKTAGYRLFPSVFLTRSYWSSCTVRPGVTQASTWRERRSTWRSTHRQGRRLAAGMTESCP